MNVLRIMYLILCKAHLNDSVGIAEIIVWVLLVLLPSQEVGRILAVRITGGFLGQRHFSAGICPI